MPQEITDRLAVLAIQNNASRHILFTKNDRVAEVEDLESDGSGITGVCPSADSDSASNSRSFSSSNEDYESETDEDPSEEDNDSLDDETSDQLRPEKPDAVPTTAPNVEMTAEMDNETTKSPTTTLP